MKIPRCAACDELIFAAEYTGQSLDYDDYLAYIYEFRMTKSLFTIFIFELGMTMTLFTIFFAVLSCRS